MMNVLALCLVFTSLVTVGFFTPSPEKHNSKDEVTVKEGHTGVVIEFEKDDGNTKVSVSPQDSQADAHRVDEKGYVTNAMDRKMEEAKEKIKEASSSVLPEVRKEGNSAHQEQEVHLRFRPREILCDAYGKCKHKIESAMGKTKEAELEKAHEVEEEAKEAVSEAIGKVKDTVTHTAHLTSDKAQETKESLKDAASEVSSKAKDKVAEKASEMKEGAREQAQRARRQVYDVIDTTKKVKEDAERHAFKKMEGAKEMAREKAKEAEELVESASDRAKHGAHWVKKDGQKGLRGILRRAGEFFAYIVSRVRMASLAGVLHLLGFAMAYGMCVWITFASNYILAGALPRHQFAMVQSKIYPVYFKAMACSVGMALLGHLMMSQEKRFSPLIMGMFRGFNLMASLVMILVNLLYLEPRATKVMFERMKKEKEEGRGKEGHATEPSGRVVDSTTETAAGGGTTGGATTSQGATQEKREEASAKPPLMRSTSAELLLRRLNSYSSLLNVVTLMSLTWHLVHLGQHLHAIC